MNDILTEKQYQAELLGILRDQNGYTIRKATDFDRRFAIDREMLFGFLNDTQPQTMEKLRKIHKDRLEDTLISFINAECTKKRGSLVEVLKHGIELSGLKIELMYTKPATTFFYDGLFTEASDKKFICLKIVILAFAQLKKLVRIGENAFEPVFCLCASIMVHDLVKIVWIGVMLELFRQCRRVLPADNCRQSGDTGIQKLDTAELPDVRLYHHGIHPSDAPIDIHEFFQFFTKIFYAFMIKVDIVKRFVIIAAFPEIAKRFVTKWLFFKACSIERILKVKIKHEVFNHLIIGVVEKFFNDKCSNDDIYWSVGS